MVMIYVSGPQNKCPINVHYLPCIRHGPSKVSARLLGDEQISECSESASKRRRMPPMLSGRSCAVSNTLRSLRASDSESSSVSLVMVKWVEGQD